MKALLAVALLLAFVLVYAFGKSPHRAPSCDAMSGGERAGCLAADARLREMGR